MPRPFKKSGKTKPKKTGKKGFKKRRTDRVVNKSTSAVGTKMNFGKTPFKNVEHCKLRYAETFILSTGALGLNGIQQVINLNSLFDPNNTGGGHQPYLFDTMATLYSKYRVDGAKVSMIWSTVGNGNADIQTAYALYPSAGGASLTAMSVDRCAEINTITTGLVSPSGNTRTVKQSVYVPMHKVEGISKKKYQSADAYCAPVGSNPASLIYLNLATGSPSGVGAEACAVQVIVDYYCTFFERIVQAQS